MFNHEPPNYDCPFCNLVKGIESELNKKQDIVYQDDYVIASIAPKWWNKNSGHVLIVPKTHYENIYDITDEVLAEVYKVVRKISIAIRSTYGCDGTSNRQHNEPAGDQEVWHLHTHVYPRFSGDNLYKNNDDTRFVTAEERLPYANKLREFLATNN
jgi:histidine triad (HIT) family protein